MKARAIAIVMTISLATALLPASAYAGNGNDDLSTMASSRVTEQSTTSARPMNLSFKYSAYLTNGKKGGAYKSYMSYPFDGVIIYKARISGNKLVLSGKYQTTGSTISSPPKTYTVKNKAFKLTSKTKYYQRTGNNNYYLKSSKGKVKKLLASKPSSSGGDIAFTVKSGKVTLLSVQ